MVHLVEKHFRLCSFHNFNIFKQVRCKRASNKKKTKAEKQSHSRICCNRNLMRGTQLQSYLANIQFEMPKLTRTLRYDAKCQLYHKTKAVGKVHCRILYENFRKENGRETEIQFTILKFNHIPQLVSSVWSSGLSAKRECCRFLKWCAIRQLYSAHF